MEPLFQRVLEATGFFPDGEPARGLQLADKAREARRRGRIFEPDASWRSPSALTVYFKFELATPSNSVVGEWRQEIWNEGFAPLLWIVSPEIIQLFNGFGEPRRQGDAEANLIATFSNVESSLRELDALAGRVALETGQFWERVPQIDRKSSVDGRLLSDLAHLERDLVNTGLDRHAAQALIGRTIFTQYLIDRGIITSTRLSRLTGHATLPPILQDRNATARLFAWLSETFNGDMFPPSSATNTPRTMYLERVADFLAATDPVSTQASFFPYQFDVIPVELISAIYEQFAHSAQSQRDAARKHGVHYTRLSAVSLVLDEVMDGLSGRETVLDMTCGSGVFLVEALRRLCALQAPAGRPSREVIRKALYEQVYGIDQSEAAIRVAAFSLYLGALELDPNPQPPEALKFSPLIGQTLFVGDAHAIEQTDQGKARLTEGGRLKRFDLIVGNPPWSFKGKRGTAARRRTRPEGVPAQPRGEGLDFLRRAIAFSHQKTRFGVILNALPFFSGSGTGIAAAKHVLRLLAPVTLVNLSPLTGWLFATASAPAVVLYARHRPQRADQLTVVQVPWSAAGARTHTFDVSPSDVMRLSLADVEINPVKLKAAAVGRRRDLALLDSLCGSFPPMGAQLALLKTKLSDGLTRGSSKNQTRDARALKGLEVLEAGDIEPMFIPEPDSLNRFTALKAQWPRARETYRAPLLVIKEMVGDNARAVAAVSERDLIFTDGFFGASLPENQATIAHLLSAVVSSSLASWFFTMTAAEFAIWKRKLLIRDVNLLPTPDLRTVAASATGKRLVHLSRLMHAEDSGPDPWGALDLAVFDLYGLDEADRAVVQDGHFRASWQWQAGRQASVSAATVNPDLANYARLFLSVVSGWLSVRNERRMRAEIFDVPANNPLRVVRFVLEPGQGASTVDVTKVNGPLNDVLAAVGRRLNVRIASALSANRELRIHGRNEVVIVKPSARRHWMGVCALDDADAVVAESFAGAAAA